MFVIVYHFSLQYTYMYHRMIDCGFMFFVSQRQAYRLHTEIVITLNDMFTYIFPEIGWIWTKLGTGIGAGKG